jgi:LuxR family maltose regulon positive regulatory protein
MPMLATKLYILSPRPNVVLHLRLIARLNEGLHGRLIRMSAPAGFGKTTLLSEWLAVCLRVRESLILGESSLCMI